jgi:hypothetical protein
VATERKDEAGLLGETDEVAGRDEPTHRVIPAHERFYADDAAALERDDRLVVDGELVRDDCALEVGLELGRSRTRSCIDGSYSA